MLSNLKTIFSSLIFFNALIITSTTIPFTQQNQISGAIIGAALGDSLGRVTEFVPSPEKIKKIYGLHGLQSFNDFRAEDWESNPATQQKIAAFTDDTVMSLMVAKACLKARQQSFSIDQTIGNIAQEFARLFGQNRYQIDPLFASRAHGATNISAGKKLGQLMILNNNKYQWWLYPPYDYDQKKYAEVAKEGGCGSVMRAWPIGLLFSYDLNLVQQLANQQSQLSHRHPMARAASVASAIGVAQALNGKSPLEIVESMITAAQTFERAEQTYKTKAQKIMNVHKLSAQHIAQDKLFTSDMIRYAAMMAKKNITPDKILGTHNEKRSDNFRSTQGFLLGWAADEAIAAAVYIFLRHPNNLVLALQEAINTPGDSDSIATLTGALVGAYSGIDQLHRAQFDYSKLEQLSKLEELSNQIAESINKK